MNMDVFKVPIILVPEERRNISGSFKGGSCQIRFPQRLLWQKRQLVAIIDKVYWQVLGKVALSDLERRTGELNQKHFGFEFRKVRFHRQFGRWGSCSTLKNINISHRLIEGPQQLLDYIILHELAHLKYQNHRQEFWNLVKSTGINPALAKQEIIVYSRKWQIQYLEWYAKVKLRVLS
jgi:predicted metal-dependent hydrolase